MHCYLTSECKFLVIRADILHFVLKSCLNFTMCSLIHSLDKYLLNFYQLPSSVLDPRDTTLAWTRHDLSRKVWWEGGTKQGLVNVMNVLKGKLLPVLLASNKVSLWKDQ